MRTNSKIRFGVMALAAALLLFLIWLMFFRASAQTNVADNTTPTNSANGNAVQVVAAQDMVAVASAAIPDRSIITPGMFKMVRLPDGATRENYVTDPTTIYGYITSRTIPANARLQRADLLGHITDIGVAGAVRPGMRAQIIPIPNKATLHDLIHVGDYVDVMASFDQEETRAVVQNVRVLAVDVYGKDFPQVKIAARGPNRADAPGIAGVPTPTPTAVPQGSAVPPPPEAAITLEVTPQQAAALALTQATTSPLDFVLRPRPSVTEVVLNASGTPGPPINVGVVRRALAPTAYLKRAGQPAASTRSVTNSRTVSDTTPRNRGGGGGGGSGRIQSQYPVPDFPSNAGGVTPMTIPNGAPVPQSPQTYKIPIYGDGKIMREDEVLKPGE